MGIKSNTVFISYRRTNAPWALAISKYLTLAGYDVFIDFKSINSGDFEQIITESIRSRSHFIVLLTPSAIEIHDKPNDWLKREIEIALDSQRNIIPVVLEGFEFDSPEAKEFLIGKLKYLRKYNALKLYSDYFDAGMDKLCNQFLNVALEDVLHPNIEEISDKTKQIIKEKQREISEQPPIEEKVLSAQEWFERANKSTDLDEQVRLFTEAIKLDPNLSYAYNNRGCCHHSLGKYDKAIEDYNHAIQLEPDFLDAFDNRGKSYQELGNYQKAIEDYNRAIQLDSGYAKAYFNRGNSYADLRQYEKAIEDYTEAIYWGSEYGSTYNNRGLSYYYLQQYEIAIENFRWAIHLDPESAASYNNRGLCYSRQGHYKKALADYDKAIQLDPDYSSPIYNKACLFALQRNVEEACAWLLLVFEANLEKYCEYFKDDPDFNQIREDGRFKKLVKNHCGNE